MIKHKPITAVQASGTPLRRFQQQKERATARVTNKKRLPLTQDELQAKK